MKYTIKVTQDYINRGKRGNCYSCPIALAVGRVFPDYQVHVSVYMNLRKYNSKYNKKEIDYNVSLPTIANDFIDRFDSMNKVSPFEFELELS